MMISSSSLVFLPSHVVKHFLPSKFNEWKKADLGIKSDFFQHSDHRIYYSLGFLKVFSVCLVSSIGNDEGIARRSYFFIIDFVISKKFSITLTIGISFVIFSLPFNNINVFSGKLCIFWAFSFLISKTAPVSS
mgnify:CR=1 FL=1